MQWFDNRFPDLGDQLKSVLPDIIRTSQEQALQNFQHSKLENNVSVGRNNERSAICCDAVMQVPLTNINAVNADLSETQSGKDHLPFAKALSNVHFTSTIDSHKKSNESRHGKDHLKLANEQPSEVLFTYTTDELGKSNESQHVKYQSPVENKGAPGQSALLSSGSDQVQNDTLSPGFWDAIMETISDNKF